MLFCNYLLQKNSPDIRQNVEVFKYIYYSVMTYNLRFLIYQAIFCEARLFLIKT